MGFRSLFVGFVGVMALAMVCSCEARKFYVGGKDGWGLNPSENFNHWAERNRFQVNDTLCKNLSYSHKSFSHLSPICIHLSIFATKNFF